MESRRYPTDLSDAEWTLLEPHLPVPKRRGRPRLHSPREILNAVYYVLKSGCQWRMLPREFPPWKTVLIVCTQMTKRMVRTLRCGGNYVTDLYFLVGDYRV